MRSLACLRQRACPACTLLTDDGTRTTCELCGCELETPLMTEDRVDEERPAPPKRRRSIESFFNKPPRPLATPPSALSTPAPRSASFAVIRSPTLSAAEPPPPTATSAASGAVPQPPTTSVANASAAAAPGAASDDSFAADASVLTLPLAQYEPQRACWRRGAAVPYLHLAAALVTCGESGQVQS